jgi:DNA invertase Pin-like site-specific DNA recombinase
MISTRTKAALAAAKERGVKLGGPKLAKARKSAVASIKALADQHAVNVLPVNSFRARYNRAAIGCSVAIVVVIFMFVLIILTSHG